MTRPLSRRSVLRGILGGSAVTIALPALQAFSAPANAAGAQFPCRFVLFFWGNGILPDRWIPHNTGDDYTLSHQLSSLAHVQDDIAVITGTEVKVRNVIAHAAGPGGLLSGRELVVQGDDYTFAGPSLDQIVAAELGDNTPFRSIEVGVQPGVVGLSFNGPDSRNPPESDPIALFERLFGPSFRAPGEGGVVDPKLALRRSVLDVVMADAADLDKRLGVVDKQRLEQHLDAIRDLENRIALLQSDPPDLAACVRPDEPAAIPDIDGRPDMLERSRVITALSVMALACDQTRVLSFWFSDPLSDVLYDGASAGHHQLTHDEPGDQPTVDQIIGTTMTAFGELVDQMRNVPEGDGTLLDHSAVLGTTDVSYGRTHQIDEFPIITAGKAGGALKTGFHYRSDTKENAGQIPFSLLQALGVPVAVYGEGDASTDTGLSELEA